MRFDAIVIGSGQGGNPLAYSLTDHGWTVALIEQAFLGGTCVNTGCTPTKTMIMSAQVAHYARNGARWGVKAANVTVDLPAVIARKREVVLGFRSGNERQVEQRPNLHLYRGHGVSLARARFKWTTTCSRASAFSLTSEHGRILRPWPGSMLRAT